MRGMVNHIDLTVVDPARSLAFYEAVLGFMGYRRANMHERGYDFDLLRADGTFCSVGIVRAEGEGRARKHDRYSPGLHHLAWTAESRDDVDRLHKRLLEVGATVLDAPADYPRYGEGYYAVFFADPDGLKLEFVHWPKPSSAA
jgi:catechol 2,3-dioxygenase-like lactoylglutathione lyase family enzyme